MNNVWIKKKIKRDLADIIDEALQDDGFYGGMSLGKITEEEAERCYHVLAQVMVRVTEYIVEGELVA